MEEQTQHVDGKSDEIEGKEEGIPNPGDFEEEPETIPVNYGKTFANALLILFLLLVCICLGWGYTVSHVQQCACPDNTDNLMISAH